MPACFQVNARDNVATLLEAAEGLVRVLGAEPQELQLLEAIALGHKVALRDLVPGQAVIKYGVRIGHATRAIPRGAWVHLHNLASDLDERSGTLDLHSGAPKDTESAYQ
jgi:altronate dehydratase small subunit